MSDVSGILRDIARYILSTGDMGRSDRLWPADPMVFSTNPLSIAYGACGTSLFLKRMGAFPSNLDRWFFSHLLTRSTYPPGLFTGLSGIALTFAKLGWLDQARMAVREAYASPLLFTDPSLYQGVAGWGLASLHLHAMLGEATYLEHAVEAGAHLLQAAHHTSQGTCWPPTDGTIPLGAGYGASGIALFLLMLYSVTGDSIVRAGAVAGLEFDLAHLTSFHGRLQCPPTTTSPSVQPYWLAGGAGIGSVSIRFYQHLADDRYLALAEQLAHGAFALFTVLPGQFRGMSGIGELMIDLYQATHNTHFLELAAQIARSVLCFGIPKKDGLAFPGRNLARISTDYGSGSAGIGLFLARLAEPGDRVLHDLPN